MSHKTINFVYYFRYGATPEEAGARFFILDEHGLITKARPNLKQMEENFYDLVIIKLFNNYYHSKSCTISF